MGKYSVIAKPVIIASFAVVETIIVYAWERCDKTEPDFLSLGFNA